jgi:unsaturated rhamnogalacturonyl hydrolase
LNSIKYVTRITVKTMDRRKFFISTALAGGSIAAFPACKSESNDVKKNPQEEAIEKVRRAMFSMQRASWEHGVAAQAMLELGDNEMAYLMAKEAVLRQLEDGRLAVVYTDNGVTDPAAAGEAVLKAYEMTGEEDLKAAADKMLDWLLINAPRSKEGTLYHTMNSPEIWSDAMYMAPPFIAAAGKYNESIAQIEGFRKALWNKEDRLFSHRWHDGERRFISSRYWGGGNGWAAACYARVIRKLPDGMTEEKQRLVSYHRELLEGCLAHFRSDGFFHDYVNEPETFVETNLGQMLGYSIYRGVKGGWLDQTYLNQADLMRQAAYSKMDEHGYITGAAGAPSFDHPGRSTEAQAFFLLMEAAYNDLNRKKL